LVTILLMLSSMLPAGGVGYASSTQTEITSYSLPGQVGEATIDTVAATINVTVTHGTDVTALVANFNVSAGASSTVGGISQISGTNANNFTSPVIYVVTSEDGTIKTDWTVTVTVAPAPTDGVLSGRVTDFAGNPVSGAVINLWNLAAGVSRSAQTNADGYYIMVGLSTGTYEMTATPPHSTDLEPGSISGVIVTAGEITTQDVVLQRRGIVAGRITDSAGEPVVSVQVELRHPLSWWNIIGLAQTDEQGNYTIAGILSGTYELKVTPPPGTNLLQAIIPGVVVTAGETATQDIVLEQGGIVTGRVTGIPYRGVGIVQTGHKQMRRAIIL
jgi:protocatechuate 3,4-dioxygenase beta subunit